MAAAMKDAAENLEEKAENSPRNYIISELKKYRIPVLNGD